MKQSLFLIACQLAFFILLAQPDSTTPGKKQRSFIASIKTLDNKSLKGRLYAVNDDQVILIKSFNKQQVVPAENIRSFSLKRKGSIARGALVGFGVGAATGIVIGLLSGDDPVYTGSINDPFSGFAVAINNAFALTAGQKALLGGLGLGATGAIVGTIIGTLAKKKFIIGGKKEKFHDLQAKIMMKLVRN